MSEKKIVTSPSGPATRAISLRSSSAQRVKSSIEASSVLRTPCSRIRRDRVERGPHRQPGRLHGLGGARAARQRRVGLEGLAQLGDLLALAGQLRWPARRSRRRPTQSSTPSDDGDGGEHAAKVGTGEADTPRSRGRP